MPSLPRPRLTYANVVSTLCLVLVLGGGTATAAKVAFTGKDIKNSSLTGKDVKDGSLSAGDLSAPVNAALSAAGKPGPAGPQGPPGPAGQAGASGRDVIASGTTVTGRFTGSYTSTADNAVYSAMVYLPGRISAPLVANFANQGSPYVTDGDPTCTGTAAAPTAPPGKACVYIEVVDFTDSASAVEQNLTGGLGAFQIRWQTATSSGLTQLRATWAYTAP